MKNIGNRRFVFIKPFRLSGGTFKVNDTLSILGGRIFYNDGMVYPSFYNVIYDLIVSELNDGFVYLREIPCPQPIKNFKVML